MIGEKIKELRKSRKMSQGDLGDLIGVSKMSISYYENGKKPPGRETLEKIAEYFNVSIDYLLGRSSEKHLTEDQDRTITEETRNIIDLIESLPKEERERAWQQMEMYANYMKEKHNMK